MIIQEKNANLKDISGECFFLNFICKANCFYCWSYLVFFSLTDEVKRICETQMKGIFFYPV